MVAPFPIPSEDPAASAAGTAGGVDFFVSYMSADRPWAEWIAWELEHAGYSVVIQAWDILPGSNFVLAMHEAARTAKRTVAVLSPAFLESPYAAAEWAAAFCEDPTGQQRKLIPVRVRECNPDGLLGPIVYIDVVGLSETAARAALLSGVTEERAKPVGEPTFPAPQGGREAGERVRRPEAGAAIFNVPVATRTFVGRQEPLQRLGEGLSGDGAVAITQVHAIHGMGGVGKTQLAARYAREHRDDYDVIWWLRAEQRLTLQADLAGLAVALRLADAEADEQDAISAVREWLELNGRWLLVFDNAPGPDAIVDLLPEGAAGGHVLITSRAYADWRALHAQPLALDVWQRAEALEFLCERTGEQDVDVVDAVAEALGDLPLALEQAAAYTNTNAMTLTGYAQRLRDRAPKLFGAGQPASYEHTVATVWQLAFEQIARQPVANELLGVSAHLAPERIPRELLEAAVEHDELPETRLQAADEAIGLLLRYALLTPAAEQSFDMHRLVGQLTRTAADPVAQGRAAAASVTALDALWPQRPWEHEQWPTCERLLAHARAATVHSERHGAALEPTASLLGRIGQYQAARSQLISARQLIERALKVKETIYGPEHPQVADTLNFLGVVQRELGELETACITQQRALTLFERSYGFEHPAIAGTLLSLGAVQLQLGEPEKAQCSLQRALTIIEAAYGPEYPNVASVATQRRVAVIYRPEDPDVAGILTNLGAVQAELGKLEEAHASLGRALAITEAAYGPEDPDVAVTLNNLATVQLGLGLPEQARTVLQRALMINEAVYGPEHHQVAITLRNLANVQWQLGRLKQARVAARRALAIFQRVLGTNHPHTMDARSLVDTVAPSASEGPG